MSMPTEHRYDVVLAEHSLHHLAPMPAVVERIESLLAPGGWFVVDEFVGPRRFQWSRQQLSAAQAVLDGIPDRYRTTTSGEVKRRVIRPSVLWMVMTDPSEAIDSARITSELRRRFEVLEEKPYGGAVLHIALADISHHFMDDDDPVAAEILRAAFAEEDRLMAAGAVASDFCTFVCRRRGEDR
jgi:SAM-dependent methyltransferase